MTTFLPKNTHVTKGKEGAKTALVEVLSLYLFKLFRLLLGNLLMFLQLNLVVVRPFSASRRRAGLHHSSQESRGCKRNSHGQRLPSPVAARRSTGIEEVDLRFAPQQFVRERVLRKARLSLEILLERV